MTILVLNWIDKQRTGDIETEEKKEKKTKINFFYVLLTNICLYLKIYDKLKIERKKKGNRKEIRKRSQTK